MNRACCRDRERNQVDKIDEASMEVLVVLAHPTPSSAQFCPKKSTTSQLIINKKCVPTMWMRSVFHATTILHIHRVHATRTIQRSWRMRVQGSTRCGTVAVIEFGWRANRHHRGRWSRQVALIVEHAFAKHLMFLLSHGCSTSTSSSACWSSFQSIGSRSVAVIIVTIFSTELITMIQIRMINNICFEY